MILEQLPFLGSISIGAWVLSGTVSEREDEAGASHFVEHMLFKGTETRTAHQIALETDMIGGVLNAFTTKECTCFYADVPSEHAGEAIDILSDIVLHSAFDPAEFKKERRVVLEEILMNADLPEEVADEEVSRIFYGTGRLAVPILGTRRSVRALTAERLKEYWERRYVPECTVISCAGSFTKEQILPMLEDAFGFRKGPAAEPVPECAYPGGRRVSFAERETEQVHISLELPGFPEGSEELLTLTVLSNVLGGNMSSRLFQKIREQRGLVYSVCSDPAPSIHTGSFSIYAGTEDTHAEKVTELMIREIRSIRKKGITEQELRTGKEQLRGSLILGFESAHAHMQALGRTALLQKREYSVTETIRKIDCVTMDSMNGIIPVVLDENNLCAAFAGRVSGREDRLRDVLNG